MGSAVSSKPLAQRGQSGMSARLPLEFKTKRGSAFCSSRQVSKNSLFKKPETCTQFQCERTFSIVQPSRSTRGSEAEATTRSRYSSFRVRDRSLDPERLRRALRCSRTNGASRFKVRRPSALGSDETRDGIAFVSTLCTSTRIGPCKLVFQQTSGSPDQAYPNPHSIILI